MNPLERNDVKIPCSDIPPLRPILAAQGVLRMLIGVPMAFVWVWVHNSIGSTPDWVDAGLAAYYLYASFTWMAPRFLRHHLLLPMIYFTAVADSMVMILWLPLSEEATGIIIGLALFTGLGYGLRTGSKKIMLTNQGVMILGYFVQLLLHPEWAQHPIRVAAFVVPFILVPIYVGSLLDQLYAARRRAEQAATTDSLTGTKNRLSFDEAITREWARCRRSRSQISMIMVDVDFFKKYNDTYGHPAGDRILKAIGGVLNSAIHRPGDGAYRIGGEEFAIVLPDTDLAGADTVATRVLEQVRALNLDHEHGINGKVSACLGVAATDTLADTSSADLIRAADTLLYQAKSDGRNRVATQQIPTMASAPQISLDGTRI